MLRSEIDPGGASSAAAFKELKELWLLRFRIPAALRLAPRDIRELAAAEWSPSEGLLRLELELIGELSEEEDEEDEDRDERP